MFLVMEGRIVVTLDCPACGRRGVLTDPHIVTRIASGGRPKRFRCDRAQGGCGLYVEGRVARLLIAWDTPATPFRSPSEP